MAITLQSALRASAAVIAATATLMLGVPASYAVDSVDSQNTTQSQADVTPAADTPFAGATGSGTESDPYLISDLTAFQSFRDSVNNKTEDSTPNRPYFRKFVKLNADIDLGNEAWTPIHGFNGSFDGAGHTISNLKVTKDTAVKDGSITLGGLFGAVDNLYFVDANNQNIPAIRNLTVENVDVTGVTRAAGIVANLTNTSIVNAHVKGSVTIKSTGLSSVYAGGIVAYAYANITDCSVTQTGGEGISGIKKVGGLAGYIGENGFTVSGNTVSGVTVSATASDAGGLIGAAQGNATITGNSVSGATVSGSKSSTAGLVGRLVDTTGGAVQNNTVKNATLPKGGYALVADYGAGAGKAPAAGTFTVDGNLTAAVDGATEGESGETNGSKAVAQVGDEYYATLAEALAAATEGQTVTLTADSAESVTVKTKVTVTAAEGATFTGSMRVTADGATITGMAFKLDPVINKNAQNLIVSGAAGVQVTGNKFTIAAGDPATGASANKRWQPSGVWLENGATGTVVSGNAFTLGQVVNNSAVGVNLVGNGKAPVTNTTVENNTVTTGPISGDGSSGSMMLVVANGNTDADATAAGTYGVTGLRIAGNTITNDTGLTAEKSKVYPVAVTATKDTTVEKNKLSGYMGVSYSVWPKQGPNDGLKIIGNDIDSHYGIVMGSYVTDNGLTATGNTFGEQTQIQISGNNAKVFDQDGVNHPSIAAAIASGATTVRLMADVTESVVVPADANVTLDLNGHKLTNEAGKHTIVNKGTLTVTDSSAAKSGTVDNVSNSKAAVVNYGGATATLAGGNYTRSAEASTYDPATDKASSGGNSYYVLKNFGTMTIKDPSVVKFSDTNTGLSSSLVANGWYSNTDTDGDATANKYGANGGATLNIEGGTLTGGKITVKNDDWGNLNITGGTITQTVENFYAVLTYHKASVTGGTITAPVVPFGADGLKDADGDVGETTIGGDAKITSKKGYALRALDNGKLTVTGGTFTSGNKLGVSELKPSGSGTPSIAISGGNFNVKPAEDELAEGYVVTENEDGTFGAKEHMAASVTKADGTSAEYKTIAEAIAAAGDGDTVQALADITLDADITVGKGIALDLNGKAVDTAGHALKVADGATLTVKDSSEAKSGTVTNTVAAAEDGSDLHAMFDVAKGGTLVIENGAYKGTGAPVATVEGTLTVNDGDFSVTSAAIIVLPEADGATLTVKGGTYKNATAAISAVAGTNKLAVAGGDFDVPVASFSEDQAYTKYITGGTYAKNPGQSTIADDKTWARNEAGRYVIADAKAVSVEPLADITVAAGTNPTDQLPESVTVKLDNGLTRDGVAVTWGKVADTWKGIDGGEFTVDSATVDGNDALKATVKVIVTAATPKGVENDGKVALSITAGDKLELPKQLNVTWSNGETLPADVAWEAYDGALTEKEGTFEVKGTIDAKGTKLDVTATVTVAAKPVECTPVDFADVVADTPHKSDIDWLSCQGITTGFKNEATGEVTFGGMNDVVRQDMAAFLYRLAGSPEYTPSKEDMAKFADVDESTPHHKEIWWLASTGITTGFKNEATGEVTFGGMRIVVRQDMAAMLHRYAKWAGVDDAAADGPGVDFNDVTSATPHADDIAWLAKAGIAEGYPNSHTFGGMRNVVRQDMAAFLHRMHDNILTPKE